MFEYKIPEYYEKMIDKKFLENLRNNLFRIFEGMGLNTPASEGIDMITSTSGWGVAFGITCIEQKKEELYSYYEGLAWMDSDIFDGIISSKMIKENIILDDSRNLIEKYLDKKVDFCEECGALRELDDLYINEDENYVCKECAEETECKDYYDEILKIIPQAVKDLDLNGEEICTCNKCKNLYTKKEGIFKKGTFNCYRCIDFEQEDSSKTNTTKYYRVWCEKLENYKGNKK